VGKALDHAWADTCVSAYSSKYDRYLCVTCRVWTEGACSCGPEDGCPFLGAPEQPDDDVIAEAEMRKPRWMRKKEKKGKKP